MTKLRASERLMIAMESRSRCAMAASSFCPAPPPSAKQRARDGSVLRHRSMRAGAPTVLDIDGMDQRIEQVPDRIGDDVALVSLDLLARVIVARSARLGGLGRLTVDDADGRLGLRALREPLAGHERGVDRVEQAAVASGRNGTARS